MCFMYTVHGLNILKLIFYLKWHVFLLKNPLGTTMVKPTSFGTEVWFIIL